MSEHFDAYAAVNDPLTAELSSRVARSNKHLLDLALGAHRIVLEEVVFAGNEAMDRARTETHLMTEFVSKMAEVHSVKGIRSMLQECGQHQLDFIRRDCERVFKHGQRMIEASFNLVGQPWQDSRQG